MLVATLPGLSHNINECFKNKIYNDWVDICVGFQVSRLVEGHVAASCLAPREACRGYFLTRSSHEAAFFLTSWFAFVLGFRCRAYTWDLDG